jgi:hypothetical protein
LGYLLSRQRNGPTAIAGERLQIAAAVAASAIAGGRGIEQFRFRELRPEAPPRGNPIADFSCKML